MQVRSAKERNEGALSAEAKERDKGALSAAAKERQAAAQRRSAQRRSEGARRKSAQPRSEGARRRSAQRRSEEALSEASFSEGALSEGAFGEELWVDKKVCSSYTRAAEDGATTKVEMRSEVRRNEGAASSMGGGEVNSGVLRAAAHWRSGSSQ